MSAVEDVTKQIDYLARALKAPRIREAAADRRRGRLHPVRARRREPVLPTRLQPLRTRLADPDLEPASSEG